MEVEGVADGDDSGGKGRCGWTDVVCEACFRVSLKHVSLWGEMFRKLRLKGLQMEMIVGERAGLNFVRFCSWVLIVGGLVV